MVTTKGLTDTFDKGFIKMQVDANLDHGASYEPGLPNIDISELINIVEKSEPLFHILEIEDLKAIKDEKTISKKARITGRIIEQSARKIREIVTKIGADTKKPQGKTNDQAIKELRKYADIFGTLVDCQVAFKYLYDKLYAVDFDQDLSKPIELNLENIIGRVILEKEKRLLQIQLIKGDSDGLKEESKRHGEQERNKNNIDTSEHLLKCMTKYRYNLDTKSASISLIPHKGNRVSGDGYTYNETDESILLNFHDVSGKGLYAAILNTFIYETANKIIKKHPDVSPKRMNQILNRAYSMKFKSHEKYNLIFITNTALRLSKTEQGQKYLLETHIAGGEDVYIIEENDYLAPRVKRQNGDSIPLGLERKISDYGKRYFVKPESFIVLTSDGVRDALNAAPGTDPNIALEKIYKSVYKRNKTPFEMKRDILKEIKKLGVDIGKIDDTSIAVIKTQTLGQKSTDIPPKYISQSGIIKTDFGYRVITNTVGINIHS